MTDEQMVSAVFLALVIGFATMLAARRWGWAMALRTVAAYIAFLALTVLFFWWAKPAVLW